MLDRLEALAREAANEAEGDWFCDDLLKPPYPPINSTVKARHFMAAADPTAVLKLIAVARAAQALADSVDEWTRDVEAVIGRQPNSGMATSALRLALAGLEQAT